MEIEDVSRAYTLFIDIKRSTEFLVAHESEYMFNQVWKQLAGPALTLKLPKHLLRENNDVSDGAACSLAGS